MWTWKRILGIVIAFPLFWISLYFFLFSLDQFLVTFFQRWQTSPGFVVGTAIGCFLVCWLFYWIDKKVFYMIWPKRM